MSYTYIKNEEKRKNTAKNNPLLEQIIIRIARKYNVIKNRKTGRPIVLYDVNTHKFYRRHTIRFIAQQSTKYIRDIRLTNIAGQDASRYASSRQIRMLIDDNSGYSSVNAIIILIVMFRLLQYDTKSRDYLELVHDDAEQRSEYVDYSPSFFVPERLPGTPNLANCFLKEKFDEIKRIYNQLPIGQQSLANYVIACSDIIDHLVTADAYIAIRIRKGCPDKKCEIKDITPKELPAFPGQGKIHHKKSCTS